ncbi:MAG: hypothetical protein D3926_22535 [Desulfobacteraceae bacterium]|nr:MAG: hypothetical protein D3926_22535 [Desulfobacteraceae bacterium]
MKTELLIIRAGADYIRVKDDGFNRCGLEKASVYPVDQVEKVRGLACELETQGFEAVVIKKLILTEEAFS